MSAAREVLAVLPDAAKGVVLADVLVATEMGDELLTELVREVSTRLVADESALADLGEPSPLVRQCLGRVEAAGGREAVVLADLCRDEAAARDRWLATVSREIAGLREEYGDREGLAGVNLAGLLLERLETGGHPSASDSTDDHPAVAR